MPQEETEALFMLIEMLFEGRTGQVSGDFGARAGRLDGSKLLSARESIVVKRRQG